MSAKIAPDLFEKQMTETLKLKGVKRMSDLIQHYKSVTDALDETAKVGFSEIGKDNYQHAKNLTLRFKKRDNEYDELKKIWAQFETEDLHTQQQQQQQPGDVVPIAMEKFDPSKLSINEIKSDKDLAIVMVSMIQEAFYNPETGFWPKYDTSFDRKSYTQLGKPGWEKDKESPAREQINKRKNEEVSKLMESEFVGKAVNKVYEQIKVHVFDVKRKEVKHAVKTHVRLHLYMLIYQDK